MKPYHRTPASAFVFFLFSINIISSYSQTGNENYFSYNEGSRRGPSRWGRVKPEWRVCSTGRRQSPIDITSAEIRQQLGNLQANYRRAPAVIKNSTEHVVQIEWKGNAGSININGTDYNVFDVHWHSPSEHTFNGTRFVLELHLVHVSKTEVAVNSIVYQYGRSDPFLNKLMPFIRRLGEGETEVGIPSVNPKRIKFKGKRYFRYMGSIPIPPCSEYAIWTVFRQVKTVSRHQVEALRKVLPPENKNNARPVQALNGRPVFLYDRE